MILYFDVRGNLKEVISYPVRESSINVNKIYIYVEPQAPVFPENGVYPRPEKWEYAKISFRLPEPIPGYTDNEGNILTPLSMSISEFDIEWDRKRDLYFFRYGFKYQGWEVTLGEMILRNSGRVDATVTLVDLDEEEDNQLALNTFSFNVEQSSVTKEFYITNSQYSYLYNRLQNIVADGEFVPYTGAIKDVNLGEHALYANKIYSDNKEVALKENTVPLIPDTDNTETIGSLNKSFNTIYVNNVKSGAQDRNLNIDASEALFLSGDGFYIDSDTQYKAKLITDDLTANRNYKFSDGSGTLALEENVVPYTGATSDVNLGTQKITANRFVAHNLGLNLNVTYDIYGISKADGNLLLPEITSEREEETLATQEWANNLFYISGFAKRLDAGELNLYNAQSQPLERLKIGPSDYALYVYRDRIVKEVDGADNTFYLPTNVNGGTFTLATQENTVPLTSDEDISINVTNDANIDLYAANDGYIILNADEVRITGRSGVRIYGNTTSKYAQINTHTLTTNRAYTLPDKNCQLGAAIYKHTLVINDTSNTSTFVRLVIYNSYPEQIATTNDLLRLVYEGVENTIYDIGYYYNDNTEKERMVYESFLRTGTGSSIFLIFSNLSGDGGAEEHSITISSVSDTVKQV